jgi:hypothetical protein
MVTAVHETVQLGDLGGVLRQFLCGLVSDGECSAVFRRDEGTTFGFKGRRFRGHPAGQVNGQCCSARPPSLRRTSVNG